MTGWAVWTDFGGVLTPPVSETFAVLRDRWGIPTDPLKRAMAAVGRHYGTDSMGALDIPLMDEPAWIAEVEGEMARSEGITVDLSDFGERWFDGRPPNYRWIEHLTALRERGVYVGMLSNMPPNWEPLWRKMIDERLFDGLVSSHAVGYRKPDTAIFACAQQIAGRPPDRCVLIDDLAANCHGARAAGWSAIEFTDADEAYARLTELLHPSDDHAGSSGAA